MKVQERKNFKKQGAVHLGQKLFKGQAKSKCPYERAKFTFTLMKENSVD